jgi:hypothetical protein
MAMLNNQRVLLLAIDDDKMVLFWCMTYCKVIATSNAMYVIPKHTNCCHTPKHDCLTIMVPSGYLT